MHKAIGAAPGSMTCVRAAPVALSHTSPEVTEQSTRVLADDCFDTFTFGFFSAVTPLVIGPWYCGPSAAFDEPASINRRSAATVGATTEVKSCFIRVFGIRNVRWPGGLLVRNYAPFLQ